MRRERFLPLNLANYPTLPAFDRVLDDLFNADFPMVPVGAKEFVPSLDVSESDGEICIQCELPGLEDKDVNVSVCGHSLCIQGEKRSEEQTRESDVFRTERRYGSFSRTVELPQGLDLDKVSAEFKNGVLTIKLLKTDEYRQQVRNIPIRRNAA